jgi:hypothetical protein
LQDVEVFFRNPENQYYHAIFTPNGAYKSKIMKGYRDYALTSLALDVNVTNRCEQADGQCRWSVRAHVPVEYLPFNVTHFNAASIHGKDADVQEVQPSTNLVYESLSPVDPNVVERPDFHYLEAFEEIYLQQMDIRTDVNQSELWRQALSEMNYDTRYTSS